MADPEYMRVWRAANPDYLRKWRAANPDYDRDWRSANKGKVLAYNAKYRAKYQAKLKAIQDDLRTTPRWKFLLQQRQAKARGIVFLLTFDEWWEIWEQSGHWENRGKKSGQYVMARFGDVGPYAVGNVRITTCNENASEQKRRKR